MKDNEFIKEIVCRAVGGDGDGYLEYAHIVAVTIDKKLHEQLEQLVNGPIWDGDIISKQRREELFDLGLAIRVCHKGEQGYTGATYFAFSVLKRIKDIKAGRIAA